MTQYLDYMPLGQNRAGQLGGLDGAPYAQWATSKDFCDYWGSPAWDTISPEIYGVADLDGEQWLTLTRLGPHKIKTVRAIVTRHGKSKEIECAHGHPYALLNFEPHTIEVWGLVDTLQMYWKADYSLTKYRNPLLNVERDCIRQSEVWGNDDYTGKWAWTRGGPKRGQPDPFNLAGTPVALETESVWFQGIGKGYGPCWVMGDTKDGVDTVSSCANSNGWAW